MAYQIIHTSKNDSIDGKEHFKIYTRKKSKGVEASFSKTKLVPVTNIDHETYEDAVKEMEELRSGK